MESPSAGGPLPRSPCPRSTPPGLAVRVGQALWALALTLLATATLVVSHLGLESHLGTYAVASVDHLHWAGAASLGCLLVTQVTAGLACWLAPSYRRRAPVVAGQLLAIFFLGVPATVLATLVEPWLPLSLTAAMLAGLSSFAAGVLWLRLLSRVGG